MIDGNIDVVSLTGEITDSVSLEGELLPIGPKGDKGDPGFSPVVTTSKSGKTTTIKFETATGNVYAEIQDGEDGQGSGDMMTDVYDQNKNGIVDNAEKVNNHTVLTDVPANAVFTDVNAVWGNITGTLTNQTDLNTALGNKANTSDLSTVATSGSYNDLSNKPTNVSTFTNDANYVTSNGNGTTTTENTSLTFSNTLVAPLQTQLKGNTSQTGTPTPSSPIPVNVVSGDNQVNVCGKNLFDDDIVTNKWVQYNTGNIVDITNSNVKKYICSAGDKFTLRATFSPTTQDDTIVMAFYRNDGTLISRNVQTSGFNLSLTAPTNTAYMYAGRYISKPTTIELYKGDDIPTTYEAYTGTTYNIDLPVENKYSNNNATFNDSYTTHVLDSTDKITITSTYSWANCEVVIPNLKPSTTYAISTKVSNPNQYSCGIWVASGGNYDVSTEKSFVSKRTFATDSSGNLSFRLYANFTSDTSKTGSVIFDEIQVQEGTKYNSYTPYGTTPIELNKIGTYQDYFYKDSGKWYLHKEVQKIAIKGSEDEDWRFPGINNNYAQFNLSSINNWVNCNYGESGSLFKSNYFKYYADAGSPSKNDSGIRIWGNGNPKLVFSVPTSILTSGSELSSFKTWLSNNVNFFYYVLATPTNTEITYQPLIEQLDSLQEANSYSGTTNINQVNNDLPFIINASVFNDNYNGRYESLFFMINKLKEEINENI